MGWYDLPEEIVEEILLRLETKPLFKLKCVSKELEGKISDPNFGRTYSQPARSSRKPMPQWRLWGMPYPCVPMDQPEYLYTRTSFPASSNGLMLYRSCNEEPDDDDDNNNNSKESVMVYRFRVCNPLTKQAVELPPLRLPRSEWLVGFATRLGDRNTNMSYVTFKVVVLGLSLLHVTVFSSETGSWAIEDLIEKCPDFLFKYREERDVSCYKGVLRWSDIHERAIVSYDPYNRPDQFGCIRMPSNLGLNCKVLIDLGGQEEDDFELKMIKYGDIEPDSSGTHTMPRLRVWGLVGYDKGEWSLEQSFPITTSCEEMWTIFNRFVVAPDPTSDAGKLSYCVC